MDVVSNIEVSNNGNDDKIIKRLSCYKKLTTRAIAYLIFDIRVIFINWEKSLSNL